MRMVSWGGSETLWHGAAKHLCSRGLRVATHTAAATRPTPAMTDLARLGVATTFELTSRSLSLRLLRRTAPRLYAHKLNHRLRGWLGTFEEPKVIVSCGSLLDDFSELANLSDNRIPYAVIIQAAAPEIWPHDGALAGIEKFLLNARRVFFVSHHNREDVQQFLGRELTNAEVIWNPASLPAAFRSGETSPTFPQAAGLSLGCVARLDVHAKGQDLILRTLALDKWRARPVTVTFYGEGPHRRTLQNAAHYLRIDRSVFAGQTTDIPALWENHHLGVLPSRYEGMPLSVIEAMMLGRANLVTATCASAEIVEDGVTGFLAAAPTATALDEALERAWVRRAELKKMGDAAARTIRSRMPADPCRELASRLVEIFVSDT
ncbi:glycosyltransferase family 4 protein [Horticoccus luteus]|uniref:Glycosyltransferase family 4 protein n=1 Tax=Horticoccus luteus TaxID=2862869 RepID=A0A8F9XLA5_9BACT|nr:glycosyltransferase family 4 protein [Horticoccus luteus]QYM80498.1 glycosyltransferase family 4 protein [Horticoccus luteus]